MKSGGVGGDITERRELRLYEESRLYVFFNEGRYREAATGAGAVRCERGEVGGLRPETAECTLGVVEPDNVECVVESGIDN